MMSITSYITILIIDISDVDIISTVISSVNIVANMIVRRWNSPS
jgi:hypothetical protein